jgi:hypothetical protein
MKLHKDVFTWVFENKSVGKSDSSSIDILPS